MCAHGNALNSLVRIFPQARIFAIFEASFKTASSLDTFSQKARILHRWQRLHLVLQPRPSARASTTSSFSEAQDDPSR